MSADADAFKAEIAKQLEYFDAAMALIDKGIFKVQNQDTGGLVPFVPKWEQQKLYRLIRWCIERGLPAQIMILKARQVGFSTGIAVLFLALSLVRPGIDVLVAAHEEKSQRRIWKIYKTAWRHLPEEYRTIKAEGRKQDRARYDSRKELEFKDSETHIGVYVAGKGELGRSGASHCTHLSEFARWKQQKEDLNSVMSALPKSPGSIALIETTANGWGDHFHNMWLDAEKADGPNSTHPWKPFFLPWWKEPRYQSKPQGKRDYTVAGNRVIDWENTDAENELQAVLKARYDAQLSKSQMQWRRDRISGDCGGDTRLFDQEFPSTPEHAFQGSGEHVFDPEALDWQANKYATAPIGTFEVTLTTAKELAIRAQKEVLDQKNVPIAGCLRLYRHPEKRECIMMADPTHGISEQSDPAALHIFDVHSLEQLAVWEGRCDQHTFGDICFGLQRHFNNAYAVIETNIGLTTVKRMIELGASNIYWHKPTGKHHADPTWQPGFVTNQKNRDEAIRTLKRLVDERVPILYDARTIKEMQAFKEVKSGKRFKAEAPVDKCDNLVMALAIGLVIGNAKYGWTQNGVLMQQRKFHPQPMFKVIERQSETAEEAAKRIKKQRQAEAMRRAFNCT